MYSGLHKHPCIPQTSKTERVVALAKRSSLNSITLFQTQTCKNLRVVTRFPNQNVVNVEPIYTLNMRAGTSGEPTLYLMERGNFKIAKITIMYSL